MAGSTSPSPSKNPIQWIKKVGNPQQRSLHWLITTFWFFIFWLTIFCSLENLTELFYWSMSTILTFSTGRRRPLTFFWSTLGVDRRRCRRCRRPFGLTFSSRPEKKLIVKWKLYFPSPIFCKKKNLMGPAVLGLKWRSILPREHWGFGIVRIHVVCWHWWISEVSLDSTS